jgi:gamma-glutamylcyclotransferase
MASSTIGSPAGQPKPKRLSYFAYAWNMDQRETAERCPGAALRGVACLDGHRFVINKFGVATIVRSARSRTFDVLWIITARHRASLDRFEGVGAGFYSPYMVVVQFAGHPARAFAYVASCSALGRPRRTYLEKVLGAARTHSLPDEYVAEVANWAQRH